MHLQAPTKTAALSTILLLLAGTFVSVVSADDNARSVPTLEFKNKFVESGIVPEVIAALDPSVSFYVSYVAADGHTELLLPGAQLAMSEKAGPTEFSVEGLNNATNVTASSRFLIYLLDADAPARGNPTARNLRHFLAGNYTVTANQNSTLLPTAQKLTVLTAQFQPFTRFVEPNPQPNTGVHRFIYALYTQPAQFNTIGFESVGMEAETANWNLSRWRTQLGLGPAIGATFFTIDTGVDGTTNGTGTGAGGDSTPGTGNVDNSAAGSGAAAGLRASLGLVAVSVLGWMTLL
ncbi:Phosphatidylethanolamine-binding protein PEBP [Rhypophila sp. PSN 637]